MTRVRRCCRQQRGAPGGTRKLLVLSHRESIKAISRRLRHGTVDITLRVFAHLLPDADAALVRRLQKMIG